MPQNHLEVGEDRPYGRQGHTSITMRIAAALVAVASFEVLSHVRGEDTITVFRNTLDRAASGVRGGATLVRASGAETAPVWLIIQ